MDGRRTTLPGARRRFSGAVTTTVAAVVFAAAMVGAGVPDAGAAAPPAVMASPSGGTIQQQVQAMQAAVDRAGTELAAGAQAWENGNAHLEALLQEQFAAQRRAESDGVNAEQAQARLNAWARRAYTRPLPESWALLTSVDLNDLTRSLETIHVLGNIGATQQGAIELLTRQRAESQQRAGRLSELRSQAQAEQETLTAQVDALRARSAAVLGDLEAAQARLAALRAQQRAAADRAAAERAAAAGQATSARAASGPCSAIADGSYANGFLPPEMLCPLATAPGQQLAVQAAAAFDRLSAAHRQALGRPLCVTDSYRSYPEQVAIFASKPSLAATPGRSQHGWGLAVDLCGGVQNYGSAEFDWMSQNAPQYGFTHPDWAEPGGSKPEPWHWEFTA